MAVLAYVLIGWQLAPPFTRWAVRDHLSDPGEVGLMMGAVWPLILFMFAFAWSWGLLSRIIEARAGVEDD